MKLQPTLTLLALSLGLSFVSASADTFDFSYTFNPTYNQYHYPSFVVSGTISGNQTGDNLTGIVTGVTVQSLNINGTQITNPVFAYNEHITGAQGGAIVSYDFTQNDFLFADVDFPNVSFINHWNTGLFDIVGGSPFAEAYLVNLAFTYDYGTGQMGEWSLTNTTPVDSSSTVPDGGASLGLLSLSMIGLVALRRKFGVN